MTEDDAAELPLRERIAGAAGSVEPAISPVRRGDVRCITYSIEDSYNDPALVLSQLHLEEPQRRVVKPFDLLEILGNSASGDRTAEVTGPSASPKSSKAASGTASATATGSAVPAKITPTLMRS